jgi:hypothetical protein
LVEVLFLAGEKFDLLIYPVFDRVCCGPLVLSLIAVDFDVAAVWFQMFNSAQFIKSYCGVFLSNISLVFL